jgi:hypothetical protein
MCTHLEMILNVRRDKRLAPTSRCQFPSCQVVLRRNAEGVRDAIKESKQGRDIYGFGNLSFFPSCGAQLLHIVRGGSVSGLRNQFHIVQQDALRRRKARFVKLAFDDCFYALIGCSLDPQEVGMAVESIRTPVQIGNVARDHLFLTARKMPFREMDRVS